MNTEDIMMNLLIFLVGFLIIFVIIYVLYTRKLKSKKQQKDITEIRYLITKFHLEEAKLPKRKMILWISIQNAFIISFVWTFITMLDISFMWQILIAFVMVFALIYSIYELYGRHLVKKGYQKKGKN